ncbi:Ig-like domain-containing protein [Paenibacillus sp. 19GGS1-52]|uniref:Ig-like domain-containing protein n=1 Tax=Paenibacillus sp. 19GGS1-52 TaxID=2758563 RepID=UPI001EFB0D81|nr:Ig-like domain-containing protein [Paenibacillus sp. 19GGS1-52]ULO09799.1 Ig-like domain-containing protein [Paenibacillus sp. 19GGS1-52]
MIKGKMARKILAQLLSVLLLATSVLGLSPGSYATIAQADAAGGNLDFESGSLSGWSSTGTAASLTTDKHGGAAAAVLSANSSLSQTIGNIPQGSYTLSVWIKGTTSGNTAALTATETGGPDSRALIDTHINASEWRQIAIRNVLVYNGQVKITITSGAGAATNLLVDDVQLALDSSDSNPISNWNFEAGSLQGWNVDQGAVAITSASDTGATAAVLSADSQMSQSIPVKPNTSYIATVRAKVDKQDVWETIYQKNYRGNTGQLVNVTSYGDRINLGVKGLQGQVLRQAPAGLEGYSLLTVAFKTGPSDTQITVYANTIKDASYIKSVTANNSQGSNADHDQWAGNGNDKAYVDNFDVFEIDNSVIKGADVSFLPLIEDKGGKYFANGVQQDCLTILSNHGVNAILNMIFVHAGNPIYDQSSPKQLQYTGFNDEAGNPYPYTMVAGYFDKVHSYDLAKRATELNMGYMPSFHYSDGWMSASKAYTPVDWMVKDASGKLVDQTLDQLTTTVYNYVYDFMKGLVDQGTKLVGVKHGNEEDGGIVWPVGKGYSSAGFKALINASYDAAKAAVPGIPAYIHSNGGYNPTNSNTIFNTLKNNGTEFDGQAYSLYGGHVSSDIINMINNNLVNFPDKDYLNVETGFAFTKYSPDFADESGSMGQTQYYQQNANGQYNWLLDYMQAHRDAANPHDMTRGFFYWETDWIVVEGAGASTGDGNTVDRRTMFNNGDVSIKEMGSTANGKMGDMMDSMYAYLWRGYAKNKPETMLTPLEGAGVYKVEQTHPTGVTLDKLALTMVQGEVQRLLPTVAPATGILNNTVDWVSDHPEIATVNEFGFVKAVSAGTATITVKTADGGFTALSTVTVAPATVAGEGNLVLTVNGNPAGSTLNAKVWDKLILKAALPVGTTDKGVTFQSSDPDVASFLGETWQSASLGTLHQQSGVTANVQLNVKHDGEATITATSADGTALTTFQLSVSKIPVSSVTLDKSAVTVSLGRTQQLKATVLPADASFNELLWTSSQPEVASVDGNGLVTTLTTGVTTIRAASKDDSTKYAENLVTVVPVQVTGMTLNKAKLNLMLGTSKKLIPIITPEDAYNKKVIWSSSDEGVAQVDTSGLITGAGLGTSTITALTEDGGFSQSATVTVQDTPVPVVGVSLGDNSYYFASDYFSVTNQSTGAPVHDFIAQIAPEDATNTDIVWKSDNPNVARVDSFGKVTAVKGGTATISAVTADGGYIASAPVYVPAISESFDNRTAADNWSTSVGTAGGSGTLGGAVTANNGNNVFQISGGGSGVRSTQKTFSPVVSSQLVQLDFDWNVGAATNTNGGMLSVEDSAGKRYLTLQTKAATELIYAVGGTATNAAVAGSNVGTGFNVNSALYHVEIQLDFATRTIDLTVTNKGNPTLTATHSNIPFDPATIYTNTVGKIQFALQRSSGSSSWTSFLDNFNVYAMAPVPVSVSLNKTSFGLLPIEGTPGYTFQLVATVNPVSTAFDGSVNWVSSDSSVAKVSPTGLVTAVTEGNVTITATSIANPSLSASASVDVHSIVPLEALGIKDENGADIEGTTLTLESGTTKVLKAAQNPGHADYISQIWSSSDSEVIEIDAQTGELHAVGPGSAKVTLTVDNYAAYGGYLKTQSLDITVTGEAILKTTLLKAAVAEAVSAKTYPNDYYSPESLTAYTLALQQAQEDLLKAKNEHWDNSQQSTIDEDAAVLKAATVGLMKSSNILVSGVELSGTTMTITAGQSKRVTAILTPAYATNKELVWSSNHPEIATVDAEGMIAAIAAGTATITAEAVNGGAKATSVITVSPDLSTGYLANGGAVTASKVAGSNVAANPLLNAVTMNTGGGAWSTGANLQTSANPEYWQVDLGGKARIDTISMLFWQTMKYSIQVSDNGTDWTMALDSRETFGGSKTLFTEPMPENTSGRYIRVTIYGVSSTTDWVGIVLFQAKGAFVPLAPGQLTVNQSGRLDWEAVNGAQYNVYRADQANGPYAQINNSPLLTNSYSDLNLQPGSTYYYQVSAVNTAGESLKSPFVKLQVLYPAPAQLTAVGTSASSIQLNWEAVVDSDQATVTYNVYRAVTEAGVYTQINLEPLLLNSYADQDLLAGTIYYYKIAAVHGQSISVLSPTVTAITIPATPGGLRSLGAGGNHITLAWNAVEGATGYNLYRSATGAGGFIKINTVTIHGTSFTDSTLNADTVYYYSLTAVNGSGESGYSEPVRSQTTTVPQVILPPETPTGVTAIADGATSVKITWNTVAAEGTVTYSVYRATQEEGPYIQVNADTVILTSYIDTDLTSATAYYYKVAAANETGVSERSAAVSAKTAVVVIPDPTATPTSSPTASPVPTAIPTVSQNTPTPVVQTGYNVNADGSVTIAAPPTVVDRAAGKAKVSLTNELLNTAISMAGEKESHNIVVDIPGIEGVKSISIELSASALSYSSATSQFEIRTSLGTMHLTDNMLNSLNADPAAVVTLNISATDTAGIQPEVLAMIGSRPVIELSLTINGAVIAWKNSAAPVTVSVPYTPSAAEQNRLAHLTVWYLDDAGNTVPVPSGSYDAATGNMTFTTTHFSKYAVVLVNKSFSDLGTVEWGREAIEVMASKGVINGVSVDRFAPQSTITRADYITLLVRTLGLQAAIESSFSDVSTSDYYYEAVSIAKALGITTGRDGRSFDPAATITREEMMTLTVRAMKLTGKLGDVQADLSGFTDGKQIASFAQQGIAELIAAGLVEGSGGFIHPQATTTRAEAAVLMYRIYNH